MSNLFDLPSHHRLHHSVHLFPGEPVVARALVRQRRTDPRLHVADHHHEIRAAAISSMDRLIWSTESASSSVQSRIAAASLGLMPWVRESLTMAAEVDLGEDKVMSRAVETKSLALVWILEAWTAREL
ncbi:unnamed protein product [Linum trigynum]|uniref:Uncharacterized protein n=1 Tax=Linum trigynum TaxID=586398 RepID=A0AAV2DDR7_9ROSI